jgi:uncharacterized protein involved in exopolysaccharide biosynthesis
MKIPPTKRLGLALLLAGLALGGAGLWLLLKPAQFAATARIWTEFQPVNAGPDYSYDPYFIQIEFEILQSQLVLGSVVTNLNLNEVWGKKFSHGSPLKTLESIAIIKNNLRLAPVHGVKLIAITFQSDDRQETAQVANGIAEAYRNYRIKSRAERVARGLQLLQQQYRDEMEKISEAQTNLDLLREKYQIKDDNSHLPVPGIYSGLSSQSEKMIEAEMAYKQAEMIYTNLQSLTKDRLREVLPTIYPDEHLTNWLSQLQSAKKEYAQLTNTSNAATQEGMRLRSLIEHLNHETDEDFDGIMTGLPSEVEKKKQALDSLTTAVQAQRTEEEKEYQRTRSYWEAKGDLNRMRERHKLFYEKIKAMEMEPIMLIRSVRIVDIAEPPPSPVGPNRVLGAVLLGLGLFPLVGGILLLKPTRR